MLDVATGPGVVALAARRRGAEVVAVDQAAAMVRLARAAGVDARPATAEALPFEDEAFDAVVANFLLNHLAHPESSVAELVRVCQGRVALSVWDVPDANPALGLFGPIVESFGLPSVVPPGPDSALFADDTRMIRLLTEAGLEDVRVDRVGWTITVEPGRWFDAVAASTPRTGGMMAAASPEQRALMRERYVAVASAGYGSDDEHVRLPAAAVVGSGRTVAT